MRILLLAFLSTVLISCGGENKKEDKIYLPKSSGNLNTISVVIDNTLWQGSVGEEIRAIFAAPLEGLPLDEPKFKIKQLPPQVFDGFATQSRIVLKIEDNISLAKTKILQDVYAKPQTVAVIGGSTNEQIIQQLKSNKQEIEKAFIKEEIKEKQRRINLDPLNIKKLEKNLNFSISIPSAYRISKASNTFFWIRKNLSTSKNMALMFYEIPMESLSKSQNIIVDMVNVRDSITKTQIEGEDGIYMAVEDAYAPFLFKSEIDQKPAYEIRGVWEIKGYTGAGPFITYFIEDKARNRYLVADGYVYAPSLEKRDYIFELEAIIKTIKIN